MTSGLEVLAKVFVTLATSPTLSLSDPNAVLEVKLSLRIADSPEPGRPITFLAYDNVYQDFSDGRGMDMFSRGAFGKLRGVDEGGNLTERRISFGLFRVNKRAKSNPDLRARGHQFLTIPGDGTALVVTHRLGWNRIFKYEEKITKEDLVPGERFRVGLSEKSMKAYWWCFGDLEGDLKDKKFHEWYEPPDTYSPRPEDDFVRKGNWVLGEDHRSLRWERAKDDDSGIFTIVE